MATAGRVDVRHREQPAGRQLVRRDAEGWITYCGRGDDVLKVAGKWLAPQEVESCLMRHPAVAECAVVGVENQDGLTKPYAFVVPRAAADGLEQDLKHHCLEHLEAYKHPRRVVLLAAFPRTHLGKIDRGALKTLAGDDDWYMVAREDATSVVRLFVDAAYTITTAAAAATGTMLRQLSMRT